MDDEKNRGHAGFPERERLSSGAVPSAPAPARATDSSARPAGLFPALQPPGSDPGYAELQGWWRRHLAELPPAAAEAWWLESLTSMTERQRRERASDRAGPAPGREAGQEHAAAQASQSTAPGRSTKPPLRAPLRLGLRLIGRHPFVA